MPNYEYTGQLPSGNAITGTFEASDPGEARSQLDELAIHVVSIAETPRIRAARPLSRDDLLFFGQQLATLAETGIALDQGLRVLARDLRRGRLQRVVEQLAADLERGTPLEDAIKQRAGLFPPLYAEVLRTGVKNNQLATTLLNLNSHLSLMDSARRLFWESAFYPIIVLTLGFGLIWFFMGHVVPPFEEMILDYSGLEYMDFSTWQMNQVTIPSMTLLLFKLSHHWNTIALVTIAVVVGACGLVWLLRMSPMGRSLRESIFMSLPGFGSIYKNSLVARFAQASALGARSGYDLPAVLRLAAGATGSYGLVQDAERLARHIESGGLPTDAAFRTRVIPAIFGFTAQVAGARGQMVAALADMSRSYQEVARQRLAMLRMILMPIFIIVAAVFVAVGVLSLFLPLMGLLNSMSGY